MLVEAADNQSALSFILNLFTFLSFAQRFLFRSFFWPHCVQCTQFYPVIQHTTHRHSHEYVDSHKWTAVFLSFFRPQIHFVFSIGCIHENCVVSSHGTQIHTARKQYSYSTILSSNHLISDYHKLCVYENGRLESNPSRMVFMCVDEWACAISVLAGCWILRSCKQSRCFELKIEKFMDQMKVDPSRLCEVGYKEKTSTSTRMQKCLKWMRKKGKWRPHFKIMHTFIWNTYNSQCASSVYVNLWVYFLIYISLQNNLIISNLFPVPPSSYAYLNRKHFFKCAKRNWIDGKFLFAFRHKHILCISQAHQHWMLPRPTSQPEPFAVCTIKIRHIIIKWWSDNPCTVYVSSLSAISIYSAHSHEQPAQAQKYGRIKVWKKE